MKKLKFSTLRIISMLGVFVLVSTGLVFNIGTGTLSSMGYSYIASICPLGALEVLLGEKTFIFRLVATFAVVVVIAIVTGKAFCAWLCPIPHLKNFFSTKRSRAKEAAERTAAADYALDNYKNKRKMKRSRITLDSRHGILGAALLSALIFGFPVFCLICPIGLTFATFVALWNLIGSNDLTWGLLVFPAILLLELLFLRKWCLKICPIGALLSLISSLNHRFIPDVDKNRCQRIVSGVDCNICSEACPELIDPHSNKGKRPLVECTKCHICADSCPTKAIKFPF